MNYFSTHTSPKRIGIAADHAGFELKKHIMQHLQNRGYEVADYGNTVMKPGDDYPDYVIPLARAVANGLVLRGIAICGSGVGATIAANKISGVKACLIHEAFSARQGVEDDDMNLICLGGRVLDKETAWQLSETFLNTEFSGADRHVRRLSAIEQLEHSKTNCHDH